MQQNILISEENRFDKNRLVSRLFQIAVALWFLRMVLPGVKYLFIPSIVLLAIVSLWSLKGDLFKREYIFEFLKTFNPLIFLGLFYALGLVLSEELYTKTLFDLFEYGVNFLFLIIFFALTYYSRSTEGFFWVFKRISRIIWISSVFIASIGLIKFLMQLTGLPLFVDMPWGTSLNSDKNFFALYSFLGLIGLVPRLLNSKKFIEVLFANSIFLLLVLNILFSYSPRSVLLLVLLVIISIGLQLYYLFKRNKTNNILKIKKLRFLTTFVFILVLFIAVLFKTNTISTQKVYPYYFSVDDNNQKEHKSLTFNDAIQLKKWEYALSYFKSQPLSAKLFGGGFDYLKDFGAKFFSDKNKIDYPHNPLLSALLYSGIIGLVFAVFFLSVAFYYTLIYIKEHPLYGSMLLVCSAFVFFSGNSLFSVPIFLFLFSLAFLIRHQEITDLNIDANLAKPGSKFLKESFDYIAAVLGIIIISPLLFIIGLLVLFSSGWPIVFTQTRVGQNGKLFKLHKFRSMKNVKSKTSVAAAETMRITKIGAFIRKTKMDELPELWNIIRGDMSFVGTRPDVPGYADKLDGDDRKILKLKPGITGPASLKYINEEELLAQQDDPQEYNDKVIWPDKVSINKEYYENWSFFTDLKLIAYTIVGKKLK